jgi:vanillate/3-O-methylgallate O-demethylase
MQDVTGAALPDVKFFSMAEFPIAGRRVRRLRRGMTGQPGCERFGLRKDGHAVVDAPLQAGEHHGLVRIGAPAPRARPVQKENTP